MFPETGTDSNEKEMVDTISFPFGLSLVLEDVVENHSSLLVTEFENLFF